MRYTIGIAKVRHITCGQEFYYESGEHTVTCPNCNKNPIEELQSLETVVATVEVYCQPETGLPAVRIIDKKDATKF